MAAAVAVLTVAVGKSAVASSGSFPHDTATWDATDAPTRILLAGDSLVGQSGPAAVALGQQRAHTVGQLARSGGAPCDLLPSYGATTTQFAPRQVVFAFVGNATSPCMQAALGWSRPPAVLTSAQVARITAVYRAHLTVLVRWNLARGATTWLAAAPLMARGTWHGQMTASLNAMYADLAADLGGVAYSAAARNLLSPRGVYEATNAAGLPVRHSDGTHLRAPYGTTQHALGLLAGPLTGG